MDAWKTSGSSPPYRVTAIRVRLIPGCTIGYGYGIYRGVEIEFAGDWRAIAAIQEALQDSQNVEVFIHEYQVLAWKRGS